MKKYIWISVPLAMVAASVLAWGAAIIGWQDFAIITTPGSNPASGYRRTWADSSSGFFKCLTSAGAACYFVTTPGAASAVQGNGTKFQLSTGTVTSGNCAKFDANGNTIDAGAACGTGSVTLQTNGTNNSSQSTLNLVASTNVTLTNTSGGNVSIAASGGGGPTTQSANLAGSTRVLATVYQNTGTSVIWVSATLTVGSGQCSAVATEDSSSSPSTLIQFVYANTTANCFVFFPVIPGNYYKVTTSVTSPLNLWFEWK